MFEIKITLPHTETINPNTIIDFIQDHPTGYTPAMVAKELACPKSQVQAMFIKYFIKQGYGEFLLDEESLTREIRVNEEGRTADLTDEDAWIL